MESVLILSKWIYSSTVALAIDRVRARGLRPVLISAFPDDRNRDKCDDHVVMDWNGEDLPTLITRLEQHEIVPIAVVNQVEPLIGWQIAIAAHYGLPGADAGRNVLLSKARVREHMRALGLSDIRFWTDPAQVDYFPAVIKPTRESAASWLVRRVDGPADLVAYQKHLAEIGLADTELIIEEYLPGTEFSVDGPVVGGRYHPVLAIEKTDHDHTRHHDAGILVSPPQQDHVREGVRALIETVDTVSADLHLDQIWLHVEARATEDGRMELLEINPRPGGGMHPAAIREVSGIDPIEAVISMSLGEFAVPQPQPGSTRDGRFVGLVYVEVHELGIVEISTTQDDVRALPGVIDVEVIDGFKVSSLDKENFFTCFAVTADSVSQLRDRVETVMSTLDYRITPLPEPLAA
ncbi:MAG TPA: ATP-grasp domain-containing protein [Actinocrinis sp.]|uniref:ATP-grasp domain-containing protein n=1 Tax=Actinocrinis sp. TaxID=1920516 RepID=UPI002DDD2870|nr:ATP-grasp domain-containing protein [Actinocrinis sp.]HEV2343192.1 ATP-grasp domain-containing protein [Actinocrinis sp.]